MFPLSSEQLQSIIVWKLWKSITLFSWDLSELICWTTGNTRLLQSHGMENRIWCPAVNKVLMVAAWWSNDWIAFESFCLINDGLWSAATQYLFPSIICTQTWKWLMLPWLQTVHYTLHTVSHLWQPTNHLWVRWSTSNFLPASLPILPLWDSEVELSHCQLHSFDAAMVTCCVIHTGCGQKPSRSPTGALGYVTRSEPPVVPTERPPPARELHSWYPYADISAQSATKCHHMRHLVCVMDLI